MAKRNSKLPDNSETKNPSEFCANYKVNYKSL